MAREDFSTTVKDSLSRRVNLFCSNPGCGQSTSGPHTDTARALNIGVAAHITAAAPGGPRYDITLTKTERVAFENGIWLCQNCGKLIDNDPARFTVASLRRWKVQAETKALNSLSGVAIDEMPQPRSANHAPLPRIRWLPYETARALLIDFGWHPASRHWSDGESPDIRLGNGPHYWGLGFREIVQACPTGTAACVFAFTDAYGHTLDIFTEGEADAATGTDAMVMSWRICDAPTKIGETSSKEGLAPAIEITRQSRKIFLSHATADQTLARQIAHLLEESGVDTWCSFKDIPPGARRDESIETALRSAGALAVLVTKSSIESRDVRAEVEDAIRRNKTVVPILVDDVVLPLRWSTLQHVRWNADDARTCANAIASVLPAKAVAELKSALTNESDFDKVRTLVLAHPEWLPMEAYMASHYTFRIFPEIAGNSRTDCFAARLDTPGPRAILVYLTSPYERPFSASGGARPHMRKALSKIQLHTDFLRRDLPATHALAPPILFAAEAHEWKYIVPRYTGFRVYVVAGRRAHYQGAMLNARNSFVAKTNAELFPKDEHRLCTFEVLSYDRLLEAAVFTDARPSEA
jgi:hypothetical protein